MSDGIQKDQPESGIQKAAESAATEASVVAAEPAPLHPWHQLIADRVSSDAVISCAVNDKSKGVVTMLLKPEHLVATAELLKSAPEFEFTYCRNVSGADLESCLEVTYYLSNIQNNENVVIKSQTAREQAELPTLTGVYETANWNEREIYDLLGVNFTGHPDMRRIMMPDNWVGHPLRKDYVPLDPEV